jgi:hypothetical protein
MQEAESFGCTVELKYALTPPVYFREKTADGFPFPVGFFVTFVILGGPAGGPVLLGSDVMQ